MSSNRSLADGEYSSGDLVIYSLTKYAGGHSDLVAGGAAGTKAAIDPTRAMRNTDAARR